MAKKDISVLTVEEPIHWPHECASCCGTDNLQVVQVGIARNVSNLIDVAVGQQKYQTASLHYPVCAKHARWAAFASWLTRKSPLPTLLRGYGYVLGVPSLALLVLRIAVFVSSIFSRSRGAAMPAPRDAPPFVFDLMFYAAACLLVLTILAYRRVPIRLIKLEPDAIQLRFSNSRFARHFARRNANIIV